jgi:RNA polymerase subunit RPABC4/transcription elongation factor Spt4
MLGFVSLITVGSLLRRKTKKSIYSELYPDKKRNRIQRPPRKLELKKEAGSEVFEKKKFRDVNLNFKYRKALINKCENCGMIITSHKKICPICGKSIELKELIKKCSNCGMTITKSIKKCPICGTRTT